MELDARLALAAVYRTQNNHELAIEQYASAYSLQQGKVDYEAYRVEQHEVGFSNQEKIGTDNIQQCVAVIIYDPESKKTALAHIDRFTDPNSLSKDVMDKFLPPANDKKLDVYLVGGRDRSPGSIAISDANIQKVTEILKSYDYINIKSADIGNKEIPSGIIFDPITGKLEHAVPGKEDKSVPLRQVKLHLIKSQDNSSELNFAFDLNESKIISPQPLSELQQKSILQRWYNFDTIITPKGIMETWQSNTQSNPLSKVVEEIRTNNPQLVKDVLTKAIETNIDQLNLTTNKKQELKSNLVNTTIELLADNTNSLAVIHAKVMNSIHENTPQKTWKDTIKETLNLAKQEFFKIIKKLKDNITYFISSSANNNSKPDHTAPQSLVTQNTNNQQKGFKNIKLQDQSLTTIQSPVRTPAIPQNQLSSKGRNR